MRQLKVSVAGGSITVVGNITAEQENLLTKRAAFVERYCTEKGWPADVNKLSMKQILEVREQPGWKNPE